MIKPMTAYTVVVSLEDRADGGLRVSSQDLPGLILSGSDADKVCNNIAPAIKALLEYKGVSVKSVIPGQPIQEVLKEPSPRDLDMHVKHEAFMVILTNNGNHQQAA